MTAPRFRNDCATCVFLATSDKYDLYFCPQPALNFPTVSARFGDLPWETVSGIELAPTSLPLGVALALARERGLLP
jgi:hypothetical protein